MEKKKNLHPQWLAAAAAAAFTIPAATAVIHANDEAGVVVPQETQDASGDQLVRDIQNNEIQDEGNKETEPVLPPEHEIPAGPASDFAPGERQNADHPEDLIPEGENAQNNSGEQTEKTEIPVSIQEGQKREEAQTVQPAEQEQPVLLQDQVNETAPGTDENQAEFERYNVLILDTSGSMSGKPVRTQIQASKKFVDALMKAEGSNGLKIIFLNTDASDQGPNCFSDDMKLLEQILGSQYAYGGTNFYDALTLASNYLNGVPDKDSLGNRLIKNIILCSDGLPENGRKDTSDNRYPEYNSYHVPYANAAYQLAESIKQQGINIHTLGFFHSLYGTDLELARKLMQDLASSEDYYHEVDDPENLEFTFGDIATEINSRRTFEFIYSSGGNHKGLCTYDDEYFLKSPLSFSNSLATLSMSMAFAAFGSSTGGQIDYTNKSDNIEDFFRKAGFIPESISINEFFNVKPTMNSIGAATALKKLKDGSTLIALAIRGGGYEAEWGSNFSVDYSGDHTGFTLAKDKVMLYLTEYLTEMKVKGLLTKDVKFWITGFSRAAATANLTAAEINRVSSQNWLGLDYSWDQDVFAYCFECPQGTIDPAASTYEYRNIHNFVNYNDVVPRVAPDKYGFDRYGWDHFLPDPERYPEQYAKYKDLMLEHYRNFKSFSPEKDYSIDHFTMYKFGIQNWLPFGKPITFVKPDESDATTQGLFLARFFNTILNERDLIPDRVAFTYKLQSGLEALLKTIFKGTDEQIDQFKKNIGSEASVSTLLKLAFQEGISEEWALNSLTDLLIDSLYDAGYTLDAQTFRDEVPKVADILLAALSRHPNYTSTLFSNLGTLGQAHYPELCWSWLAAMDPNYQKTDEQTGELKVSYGYRTIRINCSVDLNLYNEQNELVASIVNNQRVETMPEYSYIFGIDVDGQKYFIVPDYGNYRLEIKATGTGNVDVSIDEYSYLFGRDLRTVSFDNLQMKTGDLFTADIPGMTEEEITSRTGNGSRVRYVLIAENGERVDPTFDLSGDELSEAVYLVKVEKNNPEGGYASAGGNRQFGQYIQLEANPAPGYEFAGWYENGVLLSKDQILRIQVYEGHDIEARFLKPGEGGDDSNQTGENLNGSQDNSVTVLSRVERRKAQSTLSGPVSATTGIAPTAAALHPGMNAFSAAVSAFGLAGLLLRRKGSKEMKHARRRK